jgi:nucleosome binding factor SPN SPT16 subunit
MKDGVTARDVYQHAVSFIRDKKPDLEKNFVKNIGFGVCQLTIFISAYANFLYVDGPRIP